MKSLSRILARVNVNAKNHVMLGNTCKCRKRQIDQLFDNCDEDTDENEMAQDATFYDFGLNK